MDIDHLEYFIRAAECGSMSRAANELFITSQALSKNIFVLEKELGFVLFERSNRGIELTEAGRVFLGYARSLTGLAREAVAQGRIAAGLEKPSLVLGTYRNASLVFLPRVVSLFYKKHPDIDVSFVNVPAFAEIDGALLDRRADAIMTIGNEHACKKGITYLALGHQRPRCCVAADDPLAHRESVRIEDLRGKTIVVVARNSMHWGKLLCKYVKEHEPSIRIVESVANDSGGMLMRKPNTVGMGIPLVTPSDWVDRANVLFEPPEGVPSRVSIDLAVRDPQNLAVRAFAELAHLVCLRDFSDGD